MIFVITLGFDEKFALRAIARRGLRGDDEVFVILPKPVDERVERAYMHFNEILSRMFQGLRIGRFEVDARSFLDCLVKLVNVFKLWRDKRFVFCLSGGFRALILEVLLAASFLGLDGDVEVEFEDSSSIISFPLRWCKPIVLDDVEKKVLSCVRDGVDTVSGLVKATNLSKVTVWRKVRALESEGFLERRGKVYVLTELGLISSSIG
ncbi:MAG: CRISPR-associated CARF protein Csa3 [Candidatus Omnitrophica bacterium]|nr:CRISPR-associated CARF protein Csa3 [Candidatus Omnitrophota bacterium]